MEIYIPISYFETIDNLIKSAKDDFFSGKAVSVNAIYQLLNALPIKCDLSTEESIKIYESCQGIDKLSSYKDLILFEAMKGSRLFTDVALDDSFAPINFSAFYFLDKENATEIGDCNGIVCKGKNYSADKFYSNCAVSDLKTTNEWGAIKNCLPPSSAMLIIDPYLLTPEKAKKFAKIDSFIKFANLFKGDTSIPFHLTVISSTGKNDYSSPYINKSFEILKNDIKNSQIQIYLKDKLPSRDRRFFTNYTSGNIGHPFDGDTVFNQNFMGFSNESSKIKHDYKQYKEDLQKWLKIIKSTKQTIGTTQYKWESSEFINRIFDFVI